MLTIDQHLLDSVVAHALYARPIEACGVLVGRAGSDLPTRGVMMANAAESEVRYAFHPDAYLALWAEMDAAGEEPIVFYHSHTRGDAQPSDLDRRNVPWPSAHYLIIATRETPEVRSFMLDATGVLVEEEIRCV